MACSSLQRAAEKPRLFAGWGRRRLGRLPRIPPRQAGPVPRGRAPSPILPGGWQRQRSPAAGSARCCCCCCCPGCREVSAAASDPREIGQGLPRRSTQGWALAAGAARGACGSLAGDLLCRGWPCRETPLPPPPPPGIPNATGRFREGSGEPGGGSSPWRRPTAGPESDPIRPFFQAFCFPGAKSSLAELAWRASSCRETRGRILPRAAPVDSSQAASLRIR